MPDTDPELDVLRGNYDRNREWAKRLPSYQTRLSPAQEQEFQGWLFKNNIPYNMKWPPDQAMQDYDMRGYWAAMKKGDPIAERSTANAHFPDQWKTPYHKSFSAESIYASPNAPRWVGDTLVDPRGNVVFQEPPPQ